MTGSVKLLTLEWSLSFKEGHASAEIHVERPLRVILRDVLFEIREPNQVFGRTLRTRRETRRNGLEPRESVGIFLENICAKVRSLKRMSPE